MILNETVAAIADAIREKTGKSDLIAPVNFAEEIKGISVGGGSGESGDDGWVYYKFDGKAVENTEGYDAAEFYDTFINMFVRAYYISTAYKVLGGVKEVMLFTAMNYDEHPVSRHLGFKTQVSENLLSNIGLPASSAMPLKEVIYYINEISEGQAPSVWLAFGNALTPCTKEEFEALITA